MKKYFLLLAVSAAITAAAQNEPKASIQDKANVPAAVKQSFIKQYPGTTAKWEKENGSYEASFKYKGHEMSALFEANGTMTESEVEIKQNELPAATITYIKEHYKSVAIKETAKITKANGEVNYEVEVKGKDLIFDAAGKFIKVF